PLRRDFLHAGEARRRRRRLQPAYLRGDARAVARGIPEDAQRPGRALLGRRDGRGQAHVGSEAMTKRPLGRSGIDVAPLALGGNVFGWTADEATSFAILDRFVDLGFNLVDTANTYSTWVPGHVGGESETIIGKWLKATGKRDRVLIATKVGMQKDGEEGL